MKVLVAGLAVGVALAVAGTAAPDERAQLRADYEKELARLRNEHQQTLQVIRAETRLYEERVALVRRLVAPQFEAELVEERLHALASASAIRPLAIQRVAGSEKVRLADGGATPYERVSLDVSGQGDYTRIGEFFDRIGHYPLVVELENLSLDAAPAGAVRFTARLGFPTYAGWPPEPPRPQPARPAASAPPTDDRAAYQQALFEQKDVLRRGVEEARAPIRQLQAEIVAMEEIKRARAPVRFHAALALLEKDLDGLLVAFSRARLGPRGVIDGIAVGAPARAALWRAFERAGFKVEALDVAASGDCRRFSVAARLVPQEPIGPDYAPAEIGQGLFRESPKACSALPQPAKGDVAVRGTSGEIDLRAREIDLTDVFKLLAEVTRASFVVGADVRGRVNLDLERATLDQALAALGNAGVVVGPGPLRRVAPAGGTPPAALRPASREEPVSLSIKNAMLLDVLRLFEHVSGRAAWTSPVADGRVAIFATDVPWDAALEGIADSVGMTAVIEGQRFFVGPAAMATAPWRSGAVEAARAKTADLDPGWARTVDLLKMGVDDLTPVGTARTAKGLGALVYGPGRLLWLLEPGAELFDAKVEAVDATAVTFAGADGRKTAVRFAP